MSQSETSHVGIREERGFRSRPEQVPLSDSEEEEEDEGDEGEGGEPGRLISLRKRQSLSGPAGDAEGVDGSIIGSSDHGSLRGHVSRRISLLALEYVQSRCAAVGHGLAATMHDLSPLPCRVFLGARGDTRGDTPGCHVFCHVVFTR